MRFLIPIEMHPGVYREGVGFFVPGEILTLPDLASKPGDVPSRHLVPLDDEALAFLKKSHPGLAATFTLGTPPAPKSARSSRSARHDGAEILKQAAFRDQRDADRAAADE